MAEKGCVWSDVETKLLLEIWSQENIQKQLQGSFRNVNIYSKLVEELRRNGYHSTVAQCRIKKALKKRYTDIMDRVQRSGAGNKLEEEDLPDDFQYYSQIDVVMTGRPSVTAAYLQLHTQLVAQIQECRPADLKSHCHPTHLLCP